MRKLAIAAAIIATLGFAGAIGWQASAATPAAPVPVAGPYTPIHPAACGHPGEFCGPHSHHVCGPYGHHCWCAPC
jgi:hypothetical protein